MAPLTLALDDGDVVRVVLFGGGFLVALTVIIFNGVKSMIENKEAEQTRREVAAYLAEGSLTREDAEMILSGGKRRKCSGSSCSCGGRKKSGAADRVATPQQA